MVISKGIMITGKNQEEINRMGELLQGTVDKVENRDLVQLLAAVNRNPTLVKQALKFI